MLGEGGETLAALAAGDILGATRLRAAKNPMLVLGQGALARRDGGQCWRLREPRRDYRLVREDGTVSTCCIAPLHGLAASISALCRGRADAMSPRSSRAAGQDEIELLYLLGADEIDTDDLGSAFVVYQGHHGDRGAARADVILPGAAYTEKDGIYVNTEGRVQLGRRAISARRRARGLEDHPRAISGDGPAARV